MVGRTISHYKILDKIGEGGMGVVYRAEDTKLHRSVALKFLRPDGLESEDLKARFLNEAEAAAALDHPNICTIHEIDEADGQTFIVMAYVEGESLAGRIEKRPLPLDQVVGIAIQVAEGLQAAHEKGIVHRDIKPANIMVDPKGRAIIMDFGLAHLDEATRITRSGSVFGTPAFMSPEQVRGDDVDRRTDIWSLGVVIYEMVTGRLPFHGSSAQAVALAIERQAPENLTALRSGIPISLERIVLKALEKDPLARYQHADELQVDLRTEQRSWDVQHHSGVRRGGEQKPSIAVLPFVNMSSQVDDEFFSDGLTEEIINALAHVEGLRVVSRTSVFHFKGKAGDVRRIGDALQVKTVLEGSVRRAGDRLRITAQLINAADGYHLWSERFDRRIEDVFDLQDELAKTILEKLSIHLAGGPERRLAKQQTNNTEAYALYLQGLHAGYRMSPEGFSKQLAYLERAKSADPNYAEPSAALAEAYAALAIMGWLRPKDALEKARHEASVALSLDGDLGPAHRSLGMIGHWLEWDYASSEADYRRALDLRPGDSLAHVGLTLLLKSVGRLDEALEQAKVAQEFDPISTLVGWGLSWVYLALRRYDDAIDQDQKILDLDPVYLPAYWHLGYSLGSDGRYDDAIEYLRKADDMVGGDVPCRAVLGWVYGKAGERELALDCVEWLRQRSDSGYVPAVFVAHPYMGMGDFQTVFSWLDRAFAEREPYLADLRACPIWEPLYGHPRFDELKRSVGLHH